MKLVPSDNLRVPRDISIGISEMLGRAMDETGRALARELAATEDNVRHLRPSGLSPHSTDKTRAIAFARAVLNCDADVASWSGADVTVLARQYLRELALSERG